MLSIKIELFRALKSKLMLRGGKSSPWEDHPGLLMLLFENLGIDRLCTFF